MRRRTPTIARIVMRIAWSLSAPSVACTSARWGSSDVWIAWKSCSGARAISSALNTTPRSAASRDQQHADRDERLLGQLDRGDGDGEAGRLARGACARRAAGVAADRPWHDQQRRQRRREDAQRHRGLARRDPDRHRDREAEARHRLEQDERAVEAEPLVPGEVAAGEVASRRRRASRRRGSSRARRSR